MRIISVLLAILLFSACAPKKEIVKEVMVLPPSPPAEEELKLPEPPPEPKPVVKKKPRKLEPVRIEEYAEEKFIILNFEAADIHTVIATFGELLEMNYILTPGISGTVTIQSYKKFPVSDLFQIFQTILEINGLTVVKDGAFYRIVPIDTAKQHPIDVGKGKEVELKLDSTFITQLIPLEYVKASEIVSILRSLMPRGTNLIVYEPTNMLIVTAHPRTLLKFMKIVEAIDISETESESIRTFVYYVENGEAKKLEGILKTIYTGKSTGVSAAPKPRAPGRTSPTALPTGTAAALPGEIGEVSITAYEDINALIIKCTSRSFLALLEVLKKLDVPVKQVLIEMMIAEITLSDETKFGLEWLLSFQDKGDSAAFTRAEVTNIRQFSVPTKAPSGFFTAVTSNVDSSLLSYVLTALATESKLNILASPHILTMDNKEAKIEIGDEIPIAIGLTQQPAVGGGATTLPTSGQIQYKTIGTLLTVTPRITEKNMVTLKIMQEASQLGSKVPILGQDFQGFLTRKAQTTAAVKSGHTLILGGLIRETKDQSSSGIPFLSKIPILGYLFSSSTNTYRKTELILMVTPHVISNQQEADALARQFQNRVKIIRKNLTSTEKDNKKVHKIKKVSVPETPAQKTIPETNKQPAGAQGVE